MFSKKLIFLFLISFISFKQVFSSEPKKQEANISSWLGNVGPIDIQGIVCQYLDKWDDNIKQYDAHSKLIRQIAKAPNGKLLASVSDDGFVKLWDISNNQNLRCLSDIKIKAASLDISPDNKYLAIGCDHKFEIYNIENTEHIRLESITNSKSLSKIHIIKFLDNNYIIAADDNGMDIFNISDNNISLANTKACGFRAGDAFTDSHYYATAVIAHSNNHKYLASADYNRDIIIWDASNLPTLNKICHLIGDDDTNIVMSGLSFSSDNKYLVSTSRDNLKIWDIKDIKNIQCLYEKDLVKRLQDDTPINTEHSPDGKYLTCLYRNSTLSVHDVSNLEKIQSYDLGKNFEEDKNRCLGSLVFSNDGSTIIFGGNNRKINVATNLALLLRTNNALTFDRYCKFCNKTESEISKLLRCSRCRSVRYCNTDCQRKDWQNHKDNCNNSR